MMVCANVMEIHFDILKWRSCSLSVRAAIFLIVILILEIAFTQAPELRAWQPHLGLAFIVFASPWVRWPWLMTIAVVVGIFEDLLFGVPIGMSSLGLVFAGGVAYRWRRHFFPDIRMNVFLSIFMLSILEMMCLGLVVGGLAGLIAGISLKGAVMTAALSIVAPRLIDKLFTRPPVRSVTLNPAVAVSE
jgi:rod shape-determining protein MreD